MVCQGAKKTDGKSSYKIARLVKFEYDGVGLHPTTIWRYVKENLAGMSPLKPGVKGDVSPSVFSSLCTAFERKIAVYCGQLPPTFQVGLTTGSSIWSI